MPIRRFVQPGSIFGPDDLTRMSAAFEKALLELGIKDREGEAASRVARRIISSAKRESNQAELCEAAVQWYRRETVPA